MIPISRPAVAALVLLVSLVAAPRAGDARDEIRVPRSGTITAVEPGRRGITIGRERAPVLAACAGTIASVDTASQVVVVKHRHGLETRYALHGAWRIVVHAGEHVRAGEAIARDEAHGKRHGTLVFEARRHGKRLALPVVRGERVKGGSRFPARTGGLPPLVGRVYVARGTAYYPANNALEGGFTDRQGRRLYTLQDYLAGRAPYVSCAMDPSAFRYGQRLRIPELEREHHRVIDFRVVDTGGAFVGQGTGRIDICVRSASDSYDATINGRLHLVAK